MICGFIIMCIYCLWRLQQYMVSHWCHVGREELRLLLKISELVLVMAAWHGRNGFGNGLASTGCQAIAETIAVEDVASLIPVWQVWIKSYSNIVNGRRIAFDVGGASNLFNGRMPCYKLPCLSRPRLLQLVIRFSCPDCFINWYPLWTKLEM